MVAEHARSTDGDHEHVAGTDELDESGLRADLLEDEVTQVTRESIEQRCSDQKCSLVVRQGSEELLLEVRGEQLGARDGGIRCRRGIVADAAKAERSELQAGRPSTRLLGDRRSNGSVRHVRELTQESFALLDVEDQVAGIEYLEFAGQQSPGGARVRIRSTAQHDLRSGRHQVDEGVEDDRTRRPADVVDVVDHEDERVTRLEDRLDVGERKVNGGGSDITADRDQVVVVDTGMQAGNDAADHADGVVVACVDVEPGMRAIECPDPFTQERGLAVPGAGGDDDERADGGIEPIEETAAHDARPQRPGGDEFVMCNSEHRAHAGAVGPASHLAADLNAGGPLQT